MDDDLASSVRQACSSCRRQKRKCDKKLPICGFCSHTKRKCDYNDVHDKAPSAADFAALQERLAQLESRMSEPDRSMSASYASLSIKSSSQDASHPMSMTGSSNALAALFLDMDCYKWMDLKLPRPYVTLPVDVVSLLTEDNNSIVDVSARYFGTIHTWLPIVSRKRIDLGYSLHNSGPDVAALFLAMRLIVSVPLDVPQDDHVYLTLKRFLASLETKGFVSLLCLQAMIFTAAYECGHAIYPAAWSTVGACARYAEMLGLSLGRDSLNVLGPVHSWTGQEELRRTWWAIYILDRLLCLGNRRRYSFPEPPSTGTLPVDDDIWNRGDAVNAMHQPVTTSLELPQPPFTRLCQSAMLISRASWCSQNAAGSEVEILDTITNTSDKVCKFSAILEDELKSGAADRALRTLNPCALTWSALFMLLDKMCCPEKLTSDAGFVFSNEAKTPEQRALQAKAIDLTERTSHKMHEVANHIMNLLQAATDVNILEKLGPFCLDSLYCAIVSFHWLYREGGNERHRMPLVALGECVAAIGQRWKLGKTYLQLSGYYDAQGQLNNDANSDAFYL